MKHILEYNEYADGTFAYRKIDSHIILKWPSDNPVGHGYSGLFGEQKWATVKTGVRLVDLKEAYQKGYDSMSAFFAGDNAAGMSKIELRNYLNDKGFRYEYDKLPVIEFVLGNPEQTLNGEHLKDTIALMEMRGIDVFDVKEADGFVLFGFDNGGGILLRARPKVGEHPVVELGL